MAVRTLVLSVVFATQKYIILGSTLLNKDLVPVGSIQPVVQIPNDTGKSFVWLTVKYKALKEEVGWGRGINVLQF